MKILKYLGVTLLLVVSMGAIYVSFILSSGPANTLEQLKSFSTKQALDIDSTYNQPQFDSLVRQLAFKTAISKLSKEDSIQMAINMKDSTVSLFIKGVCIFNSKMSNLKKDKLLLNLPNDVYYRHFASPLEVSNLRTTIIKEPIVEIEAPKNEDEAAQNAYMPDTLIQYPAFLHLTLSNGIEVFFDQDSIDTDDEISSKVLFMKEHESIRNQKLKNSLFNGATYYYEPLINIELPIDDLRAIYRAVPRKIKVVLYLD